MLFPTLEEIVPYLRTAGTLPTGPLAARVSALRNEAASQIVPRVCWKRFSGLRHLAETDDLFLLCATLGLAFDRWQRSKMILSSADGFIVQAIGTAALENYLDQCEVELAKHLAANERLSARVSPGYGNLSLALNADIIARLNATREIGVTALPETFLLIPTKTVTAIVAIKKENT